MLFHHVQLVTSNLDKQLEFYNTTLQLPVLKQSNDSVLFQIGLSTLEFVQGDDVFYHFAFNIPPHQFTEAKIWLSKRVKRIADSSGQDVFHSQNWSAEMFYFYDAGGNIVELIARHTLKSNRQDTFSAKSLECISELGIVTEHVPPTVKRVQELTQAPLYRAEMDESFVPVGDETGLFIVVKQGRIWFPETKAAKPAPFKVAISNGKLLEMNQESLGLA